MLHVRHFFRLCKQSAQCTLARPSIYFSSNADDSDTKQPPKTGGNKVEKKDGGDSEALDALLNATYSSKTSFKSQAQKDKVSKAGSTAKIGSDIKEKSPSRAKTPAPQPIDLKFRKKQHAMRSNELLDKLRKIAEEVAGPAGPKSNEIAEDLMKKLESATLATEKPLNINELTFKEDSKYDTNQSLDLLRNKIVSEEQIYKISSSQDEFTQQRMSPTDMGTGMSRRENVRRINVLRDLDVSLHPKIRIGIFEPEPKENQISKSCLKTMERLEQRELNLSQSYAPRNWFEQCIQWTDQGKLWHFPINNEQGLEEQAAVSFTEHVFLEDHLEGWCPTFGPVRHFMELVCLGLSKNPYLSVEEKIEYIAWYRDYFDKHRHILEASGILGGGVAKVPPLEAE